MNQGRKNLFKDKQKRGILNAWDFANDFKAKFSFLSLIFKDFKGFLRIS